MTTKEFYQAMTQRVSFASFEMSAATEFMKLSPELRSINVEDITEQHVDLFTDFIISQDLCDEVEL